MTTTTAGRFEKFIGIDWSGAQGPRMKRLKVAACVPGRSVPKLVLAPNGRNWRRDELVDWIIEEANQGRILVGADFAFAYPYCDRKAYFPEHPESPKSVVALWQAVDSICHDGPNFYGGPFYKDQTAPFSNYLLYQKYRGPYFDNNRMRITEQACELFTRPTSPFKCVGPDQVGSGSAAGMRALHFITANYSDILTIWPFNSLSQNKSTLVEIFPRLFFVLAKENPRQWSDFTAVNALFLNTSVLNR